MNLETDAAAGVELERLGTKWADWKVGWLLDDAQPMTVDSGGATAREWQ
jgi:hypothetical protein